MASLPMKTTRQPSRSRKPATGGAASVAAGFVIQRKPIHEQILPHLRDQIINGRWPPGERLPEPLLCREFGVSRTPLRDALKLLEAEGFLELKPHVGAIVSDPATSDVIEKMQVVSALEQAAAAAVAERRPPLVLKAITKIHAGMKEAAGKGDARRYYRLNDDFHRSIVAGSGNRTLAEIHEHMMWHAHRARHRAHAFLTLSPNAAQHHDGIVETIMSGDPVKAAAAIRDHLTAVSATITGHHAPAEPPQPAEPPPARTVSTEA